MGVCRRILGRGLLLPRVVPRGIRGRGTGRIHTGRGILTSRLPLPSRILLCTMMARTDVVVLLGLVMVVLFGVGRLMRLAG